MFFHFILTVVSLMTFLCDNHVSSCDVNCSDKPVFTPSRLVVKYGDPTSAKCVACGSDCSFFGLERSVGDVTMNGTTLLWTVGNLTNWDPSPYCFYNTDSGDQCCTSLPVTVYQPPENVSFVFVNHTGPMLEQNQYTLQCIVANVAPVQNLVVTFYRGQTELSRQKSTLKPQDKPVTDTFTLNINVSKEDDGAQYWCEAKLELGPEGPQHPPVVTSESITATVHYGPHLQKTGNQEPIRIKEGESLQLNCSAVANPRPSYMWTFPSESPSSFNGSVVTIKSVGFEHKGQYTCKVSSEDRTDSVTFTVDVQPDIIPYIITAVVIAAVVIVSAVVFVYSQYYKHHKMGQYNVKDGQAVPLKA